LFFLLKNLLGLFFYQSMEKKKYNLFNPKNEEYVIK